MKYEHLILVTNDDGIDSEGLRELSKSLKSLGRAVVVAPESQRSASSHSLTLDKGIRISKLGADCYSVDGTPTDCILIAVRSILPRLPDLVVSGINAGWNLGDDVTYSGTVAAAMEGALLGIPSLAFSVLPGGRITSRDAAPLATEFGRWALTDGFQPGLLLNINFPDVEIENIKGVRITRLAFRGYQEFATRSEIMEEGSLLRIGPRKFNFDGREGTDWGAVGLGMVSVTPIRMDLSDERRIRRLKKRERELERLLGKVRISKQGKQ